MKLLAKQPVDRYSMAEEVKNALIQASGYTVK
jgi:hypothetical protein